MNETLEETHHETWPTLRAVAPDLETEFSATKTLVKWRVRWALSGLLLILGFALVPFPAHRIWWIQPRLLSNSYDLPVPSIFLFAALLIGTVTATIAVSWTSFRDELRRTVQEETAEGFYWTVWLGAYAITVTALIYFAKHAGAGESQDRQSLVTAVLTLAALVGWLPALLPLRFWMRWTKHNARTFVLGGAIALLTYVVSYHYTPRLTGFVVLTHRLTLWTVYFMLRLMGQNATFEPASYLIGTPGFSVYINSACSGREGIGLFLTFFGMYLWVCRRDLRFPTVFLLLPIGIGTLWLLNAIRITLLILLGSWSSSIAIEGFHSVAGWMFFIGITLMLVAVSQRSGTFARVPYTHEFLPNPAAPYLLPLITIVVTAMIARIFFYRFDVLYPLRVIAGAAALWWYRKTPVLAQWQFSWAAMGLGVLAFILWLTFGRIGNMAAGDTSFHVVLGSFSIPAASFWLSFRVLGAVLIVPLAEELAFRGYLIRKLISADFETISFRQFTWLSFFGSSIIFGALHAQWLAGTIAGMLFAVALYRRGSLTDAVTSHATTNSLLSLYVLTSGHWALWG